MEIYEMLKLERYGDIILEWLGDHNCISATRMLPGLVNDRVIRLLKERLGLKSVPDELINLYSWRDGTLFDTSVSSREACLFPFFRFIPLEEGIEQKEAMEEDAPGMWGASWFPVLSDDAGDYLVVDCDPLHAPNVIRSRNDGDASILFQSIYHMMKTAADAYRTGAFYIGDDGLIHQDISRLAKIASTINPTVEYWKT